MRLPRLPEPVAFLQVLPTLAPQRSANVGQLVGPSLSSRNHSHYMGKSLSMDVPPLLKRERLVAARL